MISNSFYYSATTRNKLIIVFKQVWSYAHIRKKLKHALIAQLITGTWVNSYIDQHSSFKFWIKLIEDFTSNSGYFYGKFNIINTLDDIEVALMSWFHWNKFFTWIKGLIVLRFRIDLFSSHWSRSTSKKSPFLVVESSALAFIRLSIMSSNIWCIPS